MADEAATTTRRERFARLHHSCMAIHIWMTEEENEMNLDELKALPTRDLIELYNKYADKQVKRMESRAKLEERAAQKLREAGELTEGGESGVSSAVPTPRKGKGNSNRAPIEAPPTTEEANMAKKTTKKTTKTAKKTAKPAAPKKESAGKRGAPLTDYTYIAISEKSKDFNPRGYKPQAESMRNKVYQAIKESDGMTRTQLEKKFGELGSVKAQLDVLVKLQFIKIS